MQEEPDPQLGRALVEQVFELWVNPELKRRGLQLSRDEITQVVVEMPAHDGDLMVSLNQDAEIVAMTTAKRDLKAGETVYLEDIDQISDIYPTNVDPNRTRCWRPSPGPMTGTCPRTKRWPRRRSRGRPHPRWRRHRCA